MFDKRHTAFGRLELAVLNFRKVLVRTLEPLTLILDKMMSKIIKHMKR